MFTVLIAEKEHIDAIKMENKLFFEPFLENKDLAFCCWNPDGQNLYDSVPGLSEAVGRRKEWRAVILNNVKKKMEKKQNPFDVVDYSSVLSLNMPERYINPESELESWKSEWVDYYASLKTAKESVYKEALNLPLQRLSTWLCFKPENYILSDVSQRNNAHDLALKKLTEGSMKLNENLEELEKEQYKAELRIKENIRRKFVSDFCLNIAHPSEIYCISVRTSDSAFFNPDMYWNTRQENEYSSFADRNMYFDKMRFLIFDLLPKTHRNYRNDYIRYLATILIFISNNVPASSMKSRRLYHFEVESEDTPLCTLVTSYDKKLGATIDVIENEMDKIRSEIPGRLTDKTAESLFCTPVDVPVLLDENCDIEGIYASKDYGFAFDYPENEMQKWKMDYKNSEKNLSYVVKKQSTSIRKSVSSIQNYGEISEVNISRLTPFQIEDIKDYTNQKENEMVNAIPPDLSDMSRYSEIMKSESKKVEDQISQRMTKKTTIVLGVVCLSLFFICFFPFLFSNNGTVGTVITALILSGSMLAIVAIAMVIALFMMREKVKRSVRNYNNRMIGIVNEVRASLKRVSKYLSALSNVRRGHAIQHYAKYNVDEYTKGLRIRKKHQDDIRRKRAILLENYGDFLGDKSYCDETMTRPYEYDFDQATEYSYPAPFLAGDIRNIEFVSKGNFVTVPSSYITGVWVKMEEIYDE